MSEAVEPRTIFLDAESFMAVEMAFQRAKDDLGRYVLIESTWGTDIVTNTNRRGGPVITVAGLTIRVTPEDAAQFYRIPFIEYSAPEEGA